MHLHTFIIEYAGGTYVSQIQADDERAALSIWLSKLASHRIADAVSLDIAAVFEGYDGRDDHIDNPVLLDGLTNAWCISASGPQGSLTGHIVRTTR